MFIRQSISNRMSRKPRLEAANAKAFSDAPALCVFASLREPFCIQLKHFSRRDAEARM